MATHRIASGRTTPGSTNWQQYNPPANSGVYLDIDTTAGRFSGTPVYIASIGGNSSHWATIGASSIYSPTATGFRVYIRWVNGNPLTPAQADQYKWHMNWIGMES
ncbi:hypothetical protein [Rivularia sp. UHCC 0363]|uniref:hypothetical protein n=1 Tax=Rivularia sp. UHCC 0363 TaxID=3110244 RepID=UPI002B220BC6|nr:hypothetical protein [Rivularia sp. UHCC 0363]MEA5592823.1 hypothetical protein [Rivularia sp. UHCC 0363]